MAQGLLFGHGRAAGHAGHDQALGGAGHGEAASGSGSGGAGGRDAGHHLPGDAVPVQQGQLFAQGAVDGRVTGVQMHHGLTGAGELEHEGMAFFQIQRGGVDDAGPGRCQIQQGGRDHGTGVEQQGRLFDEAFPLEGEQFRVTGTRADETDHAWLLFHSLLQ